MPPDWVISAPSAAPCRRVRTRARIRVTSPFSRIQPGRVRAYDPPRQRYRARERRRHRERTVGGRPPPRVAANVALGTAPAADVTFAATGAANVDFVWRRASSDTFPARISGASEWGGVSIGPRFARHPPDDVAAGPLGEARMPSGPFAATPVPPGILPGGSRTVAGGSRIVPGGSRHPCRRIADRAGGSRTRSGRACTVPRTPRQRPQKDVTSRRHRRRTPSRWAQAVGWTARAARSWRSKAVGGESRLGAPKWNPWA